MAGKEEKLRVYALARDLAIKLAQTATNAENLPQPLAYIIVTAPISAMADIMIGSNSKYVRRKLSSYSRAALRIVKCIAATDVMKESNWLTEEEFNEVNEQMETLSKMLWGLVKNVRKSAEAKGEEKNSNSGSSNANADSDQGVTEEANGKVETDEAE